MKKSLACYAKQPRRFATGGVPGVDYSSDSMDSLKQRIAAMQASNAQPVGGSATPQSPVSPIMQPPGLPDPNGNDFDAINAEKTARWGAQGLANQAKYATNANEYKGAIGSLSNAVKDYTKQYGQPLQFADGGKVESPDELMARMSEKYGVPAAGPVPQQATAQPPAPVRQAPAPQPQQPTGGLIGKAVGLFKGRTEAIDKATGYANGRPPATEGAKISGPGTPTSDSIAAQVEETGEPIRVANEERIVSKKQGEALEQLARHHGFESLDAMLEKMTGKPVGPTVKGGLAAAANGATEETLTNGPYTPDGGSIINDFKNWQAKKIASTNAKIDSGMGKPGSALSNAAYAPATAMPNAPAPKSLVSSIVNEAQTSQASSPIKDGVVPGKSIGASLVDSPFLQDRQSAQIQAGGLKDFKDIGSGITSQRDSNGRLSVSNVGTGNITDPTKRAADDSASALIDQKNSTYNPAAQLQRMQTMRMTSDAIDPSITDPQVKQDARQGMAILQAAQHGDQSAQTAQVDMQGKRLVNQQAQLMADLQGRAIAGDTKALKTLQDLQGKNQDEYVALHAAGGSDPTDQSGTRRLPDQVVVVNKRTGQRADQAAKSPQDEYKAAIARANGDKAKIDQINKIAKANGIIQ